MGRGLSVAMAALSAGLFFTGLAAAQSGPAERPPSDFTGERYVDSQGCVFVRVGVGASAQWLPRIGRDRQPVCGLSPTVAGLPPGAADDANSLAATGSTVPNVTLAVSGPGAVRPVLTSGPAGPPSVSPPGGVVVTGTPRSHVLHTPPPGYRPAWGDGRLNPYRGVGTPEGEAQMRQIWTDDVPRRLERVTVIRPSGQGPVPPITSAIPTGQAALALTPSTRAPASDPGQAHPRQAYGAAPREVRVGAGHRHVLAGTFAERDAALAAYHRLAALGLPVQLGQVQRRGAAQFIVLAGPYGTSHALGQALLQTRDAGFPGAVSHN